MTSTFFLANPTHSFWEVFNSHVFPLSSGVDGEALTLVVLMY